MDASLPEFLLLFVIGLLVLGPERMAQVAKKIGHFVGYARRMSRNFQVQLEDELEMKQIRDSLPSRVDLRKELGLDEIEEDIRKIGEDIDPKSDDSATKQGSDDALKALSQAESPAVTDGSDKGDVIGAVEQAAEPADNTAKQATSNS